MLLPPPLSMALTGYSQSDPVKREGVKLLKEEDDWKPDSCPRELGFAEPALPRLLSCILFVSGIRPILEEYFSLEVLLSSSRATFLLIQDLYTSNYNRGANTFLVLGENKRNVCRQHRDLCDIFLLRFNNFDLKHAMM